MVMSFAKTPENWSQLSPRQTSSRPIGRETSPFLDSLARDGYLFRNAISHMASTAPSHASIFTSLYPLEHGVLKNGHILDSTYLTLAESMQKLDFRTAAVVSSAAVEKIVGVIAAALLASIGAIWLSRELSGAELHPLLIAVPACAVLTVVMFVLSLSTSLGAKLVQWLPHEVLRRGATKLLDAYQAYRKNRAVVAWGVVFALLEQSLQVVIYFMCARAVGITAYTGVLIAVLAVSEFLRKIAIVLEGWGLATLVTVGVLALAGIDESEALALAILATLIGWLAVLPGGLLLLRTRRGAN